MGDRKGHIIEARFGEPFIYMVGCLQDKNAMVQGIKSSFLYPLYLGIVLKCQGIL